MKKLVVEIDGPIHLQNKEYDKVRTDYLEGLDIKVLRPMKKLLQKLKK